MKPGDRFMLSARALRHLAPEEIRRYWTEPLTVVKVGVQAVVAEFPDGFMVQVPEYWLEPLPVRREPPCYPDVQEYLIAAQVVSGQTRCYVAVPVPFVPHTWCERFEFDTEQDAREFILNLLDELPLSMA